MDIPNGDYVVEFLNLLGGVIPQATRTTATLNDALTIAEDRASRPYYTKRWRIMQVCMQSTDKPQ
jgi:hypothetical protein